MADASTFNRKEHWERVWTTKAPAEVSWFQDRPATSLALIDDAGLKLEDPIIDIGGGASMLVDQLLDRGFKSIDVLDVSAAALDRARQRLGARATSVRWHIADVTAFQPRRQYALWHDRAVFHFLTDATERAAYVDVMKRSLKPGGHAIIATFAIDGPARCSDLDVQRYDAQALTSLLGSSLRLVKQVDEVHLTPWRAEQRFSYFLLEG